ncbi:DUF1330 domain-containing protein [Dactylosporangium aurantiacum]|uniref:DUF1330 domain-containing protein n=1 Tax=Dactylosporangium aurantiacum TaxID=35754 RepID=A0A9Q9ISJ4_9ACTN|nr:DUF1330 domain-containing protein [Dactylosporangium aurantiacum]MDG6110422.1 DUF1330 domain-containing protein [Dactylosporangium aurantiacum]UWZ58594.1 DUF1330 domain-containing protein [Dactylosporangium aurantiacum]
MAVDPSEQRLAEFLAGDPAGDDGPVVMLNLLRFAEGGRELYRQYSREFSQTFAPRYGVEVIYAGNGDTPLVAEAGQEWDAVLLVRYPSRRAFSQMVADPDYRQITRLRSRALREAVLQPTAPWGGG